jgi:hypothetical protein
MLYVSRIPFVNFFRCAHLGQIIVCGDITDVTSVNGVIGAEADCNIPCPGDPAHLCGGGARLNYYTWQGDLNVWHTPEVTGWYEVSRLY